MKKFKVFLLLIVTLVILSVSNVFAYNQVQMGSRGTDVVALQYMLSDVLGRNIGKDGQFGSETRNAVIEFQKKYSWLAVDGVCGASTWNWLTRDFALTHNILDPDLVLRMGSSGVAVKNVQIALNNYFGSVVDVDGQYGSKTRDYVVKFQSQKGIAVDGEAGLLTRGLLGVSTSPW